MMSKIKELLFIPTSNRKSTTLDKTIFYPSIVLLLPFYPFLVLGQFGGWPGIVYAIGISIYTSSFLGFRPYHEFIASLIPFIEREHLSGLTIIFVAALILLVIGVFLVGTSMGIYDVIKSLFVEEKPKQTQQTGATNEVYASNEIVTEAKASPFTFADVVGMNETKARLLKAGQAIIVGIKTNTQSRNGILLFGPGGTGKSMFAKALAGELGLKIMHFNFTQANSKWVGQATEKVTQVFNDAMAMAPIVLFLDEIDSVLVDRSKVTQADGETARLTAALLPLIEEARSKGVVLIGATNLLDSLDPAAIREGRFDYKIEIGYPDEQARKAILQKSLQGYSITAHEETLNRVASRWSNYSIPRLQGVIAELSDANINQADYLDFINAMRKVQGRKGLNMENALTLNQLTMNPPQVKTLEALAWRMKNVDELESLGGSLPTGVLFFGPPGTGKTVTAKALAKSSDWGFIATSGHDLMSSNERIDEIMEEANDIRPCIVFIDEADDVFGHRTGGFGNSVTNKLLSVMDGANGKNPDVVFVAATNHPDNFDAAALRGGRFTEKVEFELPDAKAIESFVKDWFAHKPKLTVDFDLTQASVTMQGLSIANITATLQQAVNDTITSGETCIKQNNLEAALLKLKLN